MTRDPASFIKQHQYGTLSTHSQRYPSFPFGSVVPYLISPTGQVAIFISHLAEHSKNILADDKVALTISELEHSDNPPSAARITLLANAVVSQQQEQCRALYRQQFDDAETLLALGGFQFFELELIAVRLIAGFGDIAWIPLDQLGLQTN